MAHPLVSVVMSVYNGERFLREAIESILHQSFRDFEFVIIDDGSTDASSEILKHYQAEDSRIRAYSQENSGLIDSLNRGCALAEGKYIARMDADDIAVRDRLAQQLEFLEASPDVAVLSGAVELIDKAGNSLETRPTPISDREIKSALLDVCTLCHPTVVMRKTAFVAAGGYRKCVLDAEDYDLWLRMAERYQMASLEGVVLKYRIHPYQISVRKCRNLVANSLAAKAAAALRRNGSADPLESVRAINPALLQTLGVSDRLQQTTVVRYCLTFIRNMRLAGESAAALDLLAETLQSPDWMHAENWVAADLRLVAAQLYWQHRRFTLSLVSAIRAVLIRPKIIGRPVRPLLHRLGLNAA